MHVDYTKAYREGFARAVKVLEQAASDTRGAMPRVSSVAALSMLEQSAQGFDSAADTLRAKAATVVPE